MSNTTGGLGPVCVYNYVNGHPLLAGRFDLIEGCGHFSYDPAYVEAEGATALDPINMPLSSADHYFTADGGVPGAFLDCCPQEWGIRLLHVMASNAEDGEFDQVLYDTLKGDAKALMLLGSGYGSGSLRFTMIAGQTTDTLEPPYGEAGIASYGDLAALAEVVQRAEMAIPLTPEEKALLMPGASLGGARPKALVLIDGHPWIAKFRRAGETVDVQAVEAAVNFLAKHAGIDVAECQIKRVQGARGPETVFLSKRFDRSTEGHPLSYLSAATILQAPRSIRPGGGGPDMQAAYSYVDIASALRRISSEPEADAIQLYRRLVFNVLIGNRDDHLCNHGFIADAAHRGRYRLAPAFDIAIAPNQPAVHPIGLIPGARAGTSEALITAAQRFGVPHSTARPIVTEIREVISQLPDVFGDLGIPERDIAWACDCASLALRNVRPTNSASTSVFGAPQQ